jgi:hypothetical protein
VFASAVRDGEERTGARWTVELICPTPDQEWVDDAPICRAGVADRRDDIAEAAREASLIHAAMPTNSTFSAEHPFA